MAVLRRAPRAGAAARELPVGAGIAPGARKTGASLITQATASWPRTPRSRATCRAGLDVRGPSPRPSPRWDPGTGSRELMRTAGVPIVPGRRGRGRKRGRARPFAAEAATHPPEGLGGGGGKGMRRVTPSRSWEAPSSGFRPKPGRPSATEAIYAEKLIERPRHVEVQVIGDTRGTLALSGERGMQHPAPPPEVVEECPSPAWTRPLRARLFAAALAQRRAVGTTFPAAPWSSCSRPTAPSTSSR